MSNRVRAWLGRIGMQGGAGAQEPVRGCRIVNHRCGSHCVAAKTSPLRVSGVGTFDTHSHREISYSLTKYAVTVTTYTKAPAKNTPHHDGTQLGAVRGFCPSATSAGSAP
jgi:hypothetical protein